MLAKKSTKVLDNAGSLRTTIPKNMAEMLKISNETNVCWTLEMIEGVLSLRVTPEKVAESK